VILLEFTILQHALPNLLMCFSATGKN